jgi:FMN phosphatase YigB (HAD superfamily)
MRPSAVFVDCYGTLVAGDRPVIVRVVTDVAACVGLPADKLDVAWLRRFRHLCATCREACFAGQRELELRAMTDVLGDAGVIRPAAELSDLLEPLFDYWRTATPLTDALAFLREWTDCPVLVVSNIDRTDLLQVLPGLPGVAGTVTSEDARAYKPDSAVFHHALTLTGGAPETVVHVGDSWDSDVQGALSAGLVPIWLDRDDPAPHEWRNGVRRITGLDRLAACIAALSEPAVTR